MVWSFTRPTMTPAYVAPPVCGRLGTAGCGGGGCGPSPGNDVGNDVGGGGRGGVGGAACCRCSCCTAVVVCTPWLALLSAVTSVSFGLRLRGPGPEPKLSCT